MKRGTHIRPENVASAAAWELILAFNTEVLERYPEDGTADYLRLGADEIALFLVAYHDDSPVACGAIRMLDPGTAELRRMYVDPAARRRGIGRRLLEALEREARSLGASKLVLETGPRQPEAIALYSIAGFSERGPFGEYKDHPLSVFMEKTLLV